MICGGGAEAKKESSGCILELQPCIRRAFFDHFMSGGALGIIRIPTRLLLIMINNKNQLGASRSVTIDFRRDRELPGIDWLI